MAEIEVKGKGSNAFKYIFLFILFLGIGVGLGIFGTKKYLDYKKSKDNNETIIDDGPEDITNLEEYKDTINKLHAFTQGYSIFYTTKGVKASNLSNNDRLLIIYDKLKSSGKVTDDKLDAVKGANNCLDKIALDDSSNVWANNSCSVKKVDKNLFLDINKSLFNDELIDTSVGFVNSDNQICVLSGNNYVCGKELDRNVTGKLESKFDVVKVTKDEGTIVIYDKGYLLDTRSDKIVQAPGHDKYYLHSADSNKYYYELKSADNLTFKHTFVSKDRINYYYVSSELVKE